MVWNPLISRSWLGFCRSHEKGRSDDSQSTQYACQFSTLSALTPSITGHFLASPEHLGSPGCNGLWSLGELDSVTILICMCFLPHCNSQVLETLYDLKLTHDILFPGIYGSSRLKEAHSHSQPSILLLLKLEKLKISTFILFLFFLMLD